MTLSSVAIKRPVFTVMVTLAFIVLGVVGLTRLGTDLFPDVQFPFVAVTTVYPGAGPSDVETQVTKPIEDAVVSLNGIDRVRSFSREGVSTVLVIFKLEQDVQVAATEVRERVAQAHRGSVARRGDHEIAHGLHGGELADGADRDLARALVEATGRDVEVRGRERAHDLRRRDAERLHARGIEIDADLAGRPALDLHRRDAVDLLQGRLDHVVGVLAHLAERSARLQRVREDRGLRDVEARDDRVLDVGR